jgi:lipoate-protein ligase A
MTEKRYILSHNGKEDGIRDKTNDKGYYGFELARLVNELSEENEQLKKELFESEKDYIMETYSDNPIRRDEKIQSLKEEFKARFGDVE